MNARPGSGEGIEFPAAATYVPLLHRRPDHRVAHRAIVGNGWKGESGKGFRVPSCDNDESNDFHAPVIPFDRTAA